MHCTGEIALRRVPLERKVRLADDAAEPTSSKKDVVHANTAYCGGKLRDLDRDVIEVEARESGGGAQWSVVFRTRRRNPLELADLQHHASGTDDATRYCHSAVNIQTNISIPIDSEFDARQYDIKCRCIHIGFRYCPSFHWPKNLGVDTQCEWHAH